VVGESTWFRPSIRGTEGLLRHGPRQRSALPPTTRTGCLPLQATRITPCCWQGSRSGETLRLPQRVVNAYLRGCREQMICPLPRASEVSAFRAVQAIAMVSQGGDHGVRRGRGGAGDESPRGDHAGGEWSAEL